MVLVTWFLFCLFVSFVWGCLFGVVGLSGVSAAVCCTSSMHSNVEDGSISLRGRLRLISSSGIGKGRNRWTSFRAFSHIKCI